MALSLTVGHVVAAARPIPGSEFARNDTPVYSQILAGRLPSAAEGRITLSDDNTSIALAPSNLACGARSADLDGLDDLLYPARVVVADQRTASPSLRRPEYWFRGDGCSDTEVEISGDGKTVVAAVDSELVNDDCPAPSGSSNPDGLNYTQFQVVAWYRDTPTGLFGDPVLISKAAVQEEGCDAEIDRPSGALDPTGPDGPDALIGAGGDGASTHPAVSSEGERVAFVSLARNLVGAPTASESEALFIADGDGSVASQEMVTPAGFDGDISEVEISGDGSTIVFVAKGSGLDANVDDGDGRQVFAAHEPSGAGSWTIELVSVDEADVPLGGGELANHDADVSEDGQLVSFVTQASWIEEEVDTTGGGEWMVARNLSTGATRVVVNDDAPAGTYDIGSGFGADGGVDDLIMTPDGTRLIARLSHDSEMRVRVFNLVSVLASTGGDRRDAYVGGRKVYTSWLSAFGAGGTGDAMLVAMANESPLPRWEGDPNAVYLLSGGSLGDDATRGWNGDPVDTGNGSFAQNEMDLVASTGPSGATLARTYRSAGQVYGMFGGGWGSAFDSRLDLSGEAGTVTLELPTGRVITYSPDGSDWVNPVGYLPELTRDDPNSRWVLTGPSGAIQRFNDNGQLVSIEAPNEPTVTVTWPSATAFVPSAVAAANGYTLTFTDDTTPADPSPVAGADGLVDKVVSSEGVEVTYGYQGTASGRRLTSVSKPHRVGQTAGTYGTRSYDYDGSLLTEIVDQVDATRSHTIVENQYDGYGRVVEQITDTGDYLEFFYDQKPDPPAGMIDAEGFTTVVNDHSGDVTVYEHGPGGELVGITDALGNSVERAWDGDQPASATSRSDVEVSYTYDDANRVETVIETAGATSRTTATYTYVVADTDPSARRDNRVETITDASGVTTTYGYDGAATQPETVSVPCDADSLADGLSCPPGDIATTTYTYGTGATEGLVTEVVDPDGVKTTMTYHSDRTLATSTIYEGTAPRTTTYDRWAPGDTGWPFANPLVASAMRTETPSGAVTWEGFDAQGRTVEVRDPLYDGSGHLATTTAYRLDGSVASVTDQAGKTTTFDVRRPGDPGWSESTDIAEVRLSTDPDGVSQVSKIDRSGDEVISQTGDLSTPATLATTTSTYSELGRLETTIDPEGVKTWFHYDIEGRLTSTTAGPTDNAAGHTTTTAYDDWGQVQSETGPAETDPDSTAFASQTSYHYDTAGRLIATIEAANGSAAEKLMTSFHYDDAGRQWRVVEHRNGAVNPASLTISAGDHVTETHFTLAGRNAETLTPGPDDPGFEWGVDTPNIVTTAYDTAGRPEAVTDAEGHTTTNTYTPDGQIDTVTTPEGIVTDYGYDAAGRRTTITTPSGWTSPDPTTVTQLTTYTQTGQVFTDTDPHVPQTGVTDPSTRIFTYTDGGRLDTVTDANGDTVTYDYDARGNRTSRTATDDASSPVVESWTYDLNDNVQTHVMPPTVASGSAQTTSYDYDYETAADDLGRLVKVTDPTGRETAYDYYGSGAPKTTTWSASGLDTISSSLWMDRRGRVTKMADTEGTTTRDTLYTHDRAGQVTEIDTPEYDLGFLWDLQGNQHEVTHPDGARFQYTHLRTGQIDDLNAWSTSASLWVPVAGYTYDDDGREANEWIYAADDSTRDWTYNGAGQLVGFDQAQWTQDSAWETYDADLTYNAAGRLASEQVNSGTVATMTYDDAGQLVDQDGDIDYAYTYGTRGNRLTQTIDTDTTTYTTNPNGSVASATTGTVVTTYDYDDAGRRTEEHTADDGTTTETVTYDYDARGKPDLTTTAIPGQYDRTVKHHYDGTSSRFGIDIDDGYNPFTFIFPYDTTRTVAQPLGTIRNSTMTIRTQAGNRGLSYSLGGYIQWFKYDARGSQIKPDNNTNVAQEPPTHYDPYGTPTGENGSGTFYRSELYFDNIHLRNRDYDPHTGQFTTQDPLDGVDGTPTVANPYHYVDNDPHNRIDPLGLRSGDGAISGGQAGAACDAVGGRLVAWADSGARVCMEPGLEEGSYCWPPTSPGGNPIVMHRGSCAVKTERITCARGPSFLDPICRNSDAIVLGLSVVAVVAVGVATAGLAYAAVVSVGGSAGIAIPTGGLLATEVGTVVGAGTIVLAPTTAAAITGASTTSAGLAWLYHMARETSGKSGATDVPSWVRNNPEYHPKPSDRGPTEFAKRVMDDRYGGNWSRSGKFAREFSQIKKWFSRHF